MNVKLVDKVTLRRVKKAAGLAVRVARVFRSWKTITGDDNPALDILLRDTVVDQIVRRSEFTKMQGFRVHA